ncbi:MAG: low-specificity L-threonine aldolase [SAR202 cluster bacterium]|nr:low-specificity L-threonine aldolase [SAR202 cluster bacterium]
MQSSKNNVRIIDLRSDTLTQPTPEMRRAIAEAELGDDVYGEDPTVNRLEEVSARLTGKEAGLLVVSGSMGNLVSALAWAGRGDEIIVGADAHVITNEMGSVAALGGVEMRAVPNDRRGMLSPEAVRNAIRPKAGYFPRTALLWIENTHNRGNGAALSVDEMWRVTDIAHGEGIPVHIDGARLFNAAVALGVPASDLSSVADSVTFCLSKGLACPVGSMVCGSREFIGRARRARKMLGGGMRQAGIIAAAGLVALDTMIDRLAEDHDNAKRLAVGLSRMPGIAVDPAHIETNIVYVTVGGKPAPELAAAMRARGVLANSMGNWIRFVTHYGINAEDVDEALDVIGDATRATVSAG